MSVVNTKLTSNTTNPSDTDTPATEDPNGVENLGFLFVPLAVLVTVMLLSVMVYLMARNRRKLTNMYRRAHVPSFSFDDVSDSEEDEDPTVCLLNGKLIVDNTHDSYHIPTYNEKRELYT